MEKLGVRRDSTRRVFRTPELRYADLGGGYVNLHVLRHIELCIKKIVLLYVKKHNLKNNVRRRRGKGSVCTALEANVSCSRLAGRGSWEPGSWREWSEDPARNLCLSRGQRGLWEGS